MSRPSRSVPEDEERPVRVRLAVIPDLVTQRRQRDAVDVESVEELLIDTVPGERRRDRSSDRRQDEQDHQVGSGDQGRRVGTKPAQEPRTEAGLESRGIGAQYVGVLGAGAGDPHR